MNRTDFLAALALRLGDLPADEREEAVKYYSEYLDEVGIDGEDTAITELGGAEKVSNIIRANCGLGPFRPTQTPAATPEPTCDGPSYAQAVEDTVQSACAAAQGAQAAAAPGATPLTPPVYTSPSGNPFAGQAPDARKVYGAAASGAPQSNCVPPTYTASAPQAQYNQRNTRILWILILAVTFPVWIGLLGVLLGMMFGIVMTFFGLVFSGITMFFTGIVYAAFSLPLFSTSPATAVASIGLALLASGIGALLGSSMLYACSKALPWMWHTIGRFFGWLRGKVSGYHV